MVSRRFTEEAFADPQIGTIVNTGDPIQPRAFLPKLLPVKSPDPTLFEHDLHCAIEKLGDLNGSARFLESASDVVVLIRLGESLSTCRIEGTISSEAEVLMAKKGSPQLGAQSRQAAREVLNYDAAMKLAEQTVRRMEGRITGAMIQEWHQALLQDVRGENLTPGKYRTNQVWIGKPTRFVPPPAFHVEALMANLVEFINADLKDLGLHPLVRASVAHYQFETIHPFSDGNGRIGRLLFAMMVWRDSILDEPWLYLSQYMEENKDDYMNLLYDVSARGAWTEWVSFCLRGIADQCSRTVQHITSVLALTKSYRERVSQSGSNPRLLPIVDRLIREPMIKVADVMEWTDTSRSTATRYIKALEELNILKKMDGTNPSLFFAIDVHVSLYRSRAASGLFLQPSPLPPPPPEPNGQQG